LAKPDGWVAAAIRTTSADWPFWVRTAGTPRASPIPHATPGLDPAAPVAPPRRRGLGNAIMWMHDAAQLHWRKRVTRSIPWRPEWLREIDGKKSGPAGSGVSAPPTPVTVRTVLDGETPRGPTRRSAPSFRARLRVARPCRHG
jgi:hypothetical protein